MKTAAFCGSEVVGTGESEEGEGGVSRSEDPSSRDEVKEVTMATQVSLRSAFKATMSPIEMVKLPFRAPIMGGWDERRVRLACRSWFVGRVIGVLEDDELLSWSGETLEDVGGVGRAVVSSEGPYIHSQVASSESGGSRA